RRWSVVPEHRVGPVRLLEPRDLVAGERELRGGECVLEMLGLRRTDDRRGDARLVQQPRERDLRGRDAALARDLDRTLDDVEVFVAPVQLVRVRVGLGARRAPLAGARARPGEPAARERAPRQYAETRVDALRDHLALLLAVEEVVVVLHRHELGPAVPRGHALRRREL